MNKTLSKTVKQLLIPATLFLVFVICIGLGMIFMTGNTVDIDYDMNYYSGVQLLPFHIDLPFASTIVLVCFSFCLAVFVFISNMKTIKAAKVTEQELIIENTSLVQLNHMQTELMNTIFHEVRTPLAVLASYSSLVALELKSKNGDERTIADLDKIVEEAKRVSSLMESMNRIALNGEKSKKRVKLDLGELIEQAAGLYQHIFEQRDIKMELVLADELLVFVSPEELTQVLFNLLKNAKDHTEEGKVSIIAKKENDEIIVTVSDTGSGIPSELLPKLFERGVTTNELGMGIGLAICKEIIEAHNGVIIIESELAGRRKGTRVTFTLPAVRKDDENDRV